MMIVRCFFGGPSLIRLLLKETPLFLCLHPFSCFVSLTVLHGIQGFVLNQKSGFSGSF